MTDFLARNAEVSDQVAGNVGPNRRFACPGLFRIVPSRDGGICRIKLARGRVTGAQLRAIAGAADRYANPQVEVTNRANIQIRGIRTGCEDDVVAAIMAAGIGPGTAGADDVRNVMVSPTAGIDPVAIIDVSGLVDRVLARLETQPAYHALSPKFSIQIDGGESVAMLEHPNDIWFAATDAAHFAFGLAGCPGDVGGTVGVVATGHVEETLFAILDRFILEIGKANSAGTIISRLRHLLVDMRADELAAHLPLVSKGAAEVWNRHRLSFGHIGRHGQRQDGLVWLGAVPPLGRLDNTMLHGLAGLADEVSGGEIRMTPWQSVLLPNVAFARAPAAMGRLTELGFVTASGPALARTVTCAGSIGCKSGLADTRTDALALAARLDMQKVQVLGLHLTGCGKSCAAPRPAPVTLLGVSPGHYDIFLRNDAETAGFGKLVGSDLTIEQAGDLLADHYSRVPE